MYFRGRETWFLPFESAHEFPSYSASIFVVYEQAIIYQVFNDGLLLSSGWKASLSQTACQALCTLPSVQHNWEGQLWPAEARQDQKGKEDSGRYTKGPLMSSDTTWCHVTLSWRIMLSAYFQVCFQLFMSLTLLLLETGRALYIFQVKQTWKEDNLTFKDYFN